MGRANESSERRHEARATDGCDPLDGTGLDRNGLACRLRRTGGGTSNSVTG